jgi:hypothetical protein
MDLKECEDEKEYAVETVSDGVQLELVPLGRPPGKPFRELMVVEGVEGSHRDLQGDEHPKDVGDHG